MKSVAAAVAILFCVGCQRDNDGAELRRRIESMESRLTTAEAEFRLFAGTNYTAQSAAIPASGPSRIEDAEWRRELREDFRALHLQVIDHPTLLEVDVEVRRILDERAAAFKNQASRPGAAVPQPVKGEQLKDGVPISVWNQIAERVAKSHPDSFSLQELLIRSEIEAWQKIHR